MTKEWNAALYHQISAPQVSWGKRVLERVRLQGNERVLDAGCGTGRLTRDLLEALPQGTVVALDVSQNMIEAAQRYLGPDFPGRVEFVRCDLLELPFENEFDGIFSTASFHWVRDHEKLFRNLYRALRPGGWLVAQCGGKHNLERFLKRVGQLAREPKYDRYFAGYELPWEFSDADTAAARLRKAGFAQVETSLEEAPVTFSDPNEFRQFVESVILRNHLLRLPEGKMRQEFMDELTHRCAVEKPFVLDYWRLNLSGRGVS